MKEVVNPEHFYTRFKEEWDTMENMVRQNSMG